jgi:hypothetical protein
METFDDTKGGGGGACLQSAYRLFRSICISSALTDRLPAATPCWSQIDWTEMAAGHFGIVMRTLLI